ncbi:MAG: radical SAM protein [Elusimicrobiota bacterium]|nr:radical SAM protein [Elusimicrobiota bacterium]
MKRIDIKIGFDCNNYCDFCAQGDKRIGNEKKSLKEIKALLTGAKKKDVSGVVFTGGEPTMHPDLIDAVKTAKKLGFTSIQIQTNGRKLAYYGYCLELKRAGVSEMGPSLHGSKAEIHDGLTHAKGSFKEVVKGIMNCKKLGMYVLTNTVITTANYKDLPDLARLFAYLKVDHFQFAFVHVIGSALKNKKWIVPQKKKIVKYVHKGLDIGMSAGINCFTEAIPYCFMKGYEHCVAEQVIPEGPVSDADIYVESYGDYRRDEGKTKAKKCKKCLYFEKCEGPWREYPEIYGWDEFEPVREKDN